MKLVVQIPCFNEATTLPLVLAAIPRSVTGITSVEVLVVDDGSTDATAEVARRLGVQHVLCLPGDNRRWLGRAFRAGVDYALSIGADVVVNTDGDNQYPSESIPFLVAPILEGRAQIVIGDRRPNRDLLSSPFKKAVQCLGNDLLSLLIGKKVPDAVSGFRAYSREALLKINVITDFSYTVDTLIQAEKKGLDTVWLPVRSNPPTRPSRLMRNVPDMAGRSAVAIFRLFAVYEPFRIFLVASALFFVPAALLLTRFFYFYLFVPSHAAGHVQSVIIGAAFLVIAVQLLLFGILGGLLGINRRLIEDLLTRVRANEARYTSDENSKLANSK